MKIKDVEFPVKFHPFFEPKKIKVVYGGRSGAKSWSIARALLLMGVQKPLRILCVRETMMSIGDSVHKLLVNQISALGLDDFYDVEKSIIRGKNSPNPNKCTEFIFKGIRRDVNQIKSTEGVHLTWAEEADNISKNSWEVLMPTIFRKSVAKGDVMDSELWLSFNPQLADDDTYVRFVTNPPPGESVVIKMNYDDLPPDWVPSGVLSEIEYMKETNPLLYRHVYLGECRAVMEGSVYEHQIIMAETEGWFRSVPYDPSYPVSAYWDLGRNDATSIWVVQMVGGLYHIIDFVEAIKKTPHDFLEMLKMKDYVIDKHWLPHDASSLKSEHKWSIEEQVRGRGYNVGVVPKIGIADGIAAVRSLFPVMRFDAEKCKVGLNHLRKYHYETIPTMEDGIMRLSEKPIHDETSNAADALRYLAVSLRPPKVVKETKFNIRRVNSNPNGWMSL